MDEVPAYLDEASGVSPPDSATKAERLVRLLIRHQDDLYRYIFSLLPHEEDARDALQEACVALYRKQESYDESKPFLPWANGFAYLEVLKQRERTTRANPHFRAEIVELLARDREQQENELHARLAALEHCLAALPPEDQSMIRQRYTLGRPVDEIIERLGTSRRSFFRHLDRIRQTLLLCINRRLQQA